MTERRGIRLALLAVVCAAAAWLTPGVAAPDERVHPPGVWVRVGRLHVGDGTVVEDALVRIDRGKFASVGRGDAPAGARVLAYPGAHAAPGFVDAITSLGVRGGATESVEALTPGVRATDAFDPDARALEGLLASGTTSIGLLPAPANVACGRAGAAGLRPGRPATVLLRAGRPVFALQAPALGPNRVPATLAGARLFLGAALRGERWQTPAETDPPVRDEALSRLAKLGRSEVLVHVDSVRAATTAVDVLRARDLEPVLVGLRETSEDPEAVAALGAPCVVTSLGTDDPVHVLSLPGALTRSGARVAISSGAPARSARSLRLALGLAVAHGLPPEKAVGAVTHEPALALGIDDRVGRVAEGLEADLLVFDGPPWEPRSRLLLVLADGHVAVRSGQGGAK